MAPVHQAPLPRTDLLHKTPPRSSSRYAMPSERSCCSCTVALTPTPSPCAVPTTHSYAASQMPEYKSLVDDAVTYAKKNGKTDAEKLELAQDKLCVNVSQTPLKKDTKNP